MDGKETEALPYSHMLPSMHGIWIYIVIVLGAFIWAGASPLYTTLLQEAKGLEPAYVGTAIGLAGTIGMTGAFIAPPLGNSLASISPGAPILFWAGLTAAGLPFFLLLRKRALSRESVSERSAA